MKPAIALVLLLLIASTFSATTQDRDFISGLDTVSCDGWIANKRIGPGSAQFSQYRTFTTWLLGFTAGARYKDPQLGEVDKLGTVRTLAHP
jgi:hypothetical protein